MLVKNHEIFIAAPVLKSLFEKSLDAKTSYSIKKLVQKISPVIENIEEVRTQLIKKYGEDKGDGQTSVKPENMKLFMDEFNLIMDEEQDIDMNRIVIDVEKPQNKELNISGADLLKADAFIEISNG